MNPAGAPACTRCGTPLTPAYGPPGGARRHVRGSGPNTAKILIIFVLVTVGLAGIAVVVVGLNVFRAVRQVSQEETAMTEMSAIYTLRALSIAEEHYYAENLYYASVEELAENGYVDPAWSERFTENGYTFSEVLVTHEGFEFKAEPEDADSERRAFNVTEDGIVRYATGGKAPTGKSGQPVESHKEADPFAGEDMFEN